MSDSRVDALVTGEALVDIVDGVSIPGGSPLNVAIGLARAGSETVLHTALGRDVDGAMVHAHATASGVAVTPESMVSGATSRALVAVDAGGAPEYRFDVTWDPAPVPPGLTARLTHAGSIAIFMDPGASMTRTMLTDARGAVTSLDVNIRPALIGSSASARAIVDELVREVDIVKGSDEDLAWLYPGKTIDEVLDGWVGDGARLAVVTTGARGALARTATASIAVTAPSVAVVDTIGAGDAFMSGLLHATLGLAVEPGDIRAALDRAKAGGLRSLLTVAARSASIAVSRRGADPPWASELLDDGIEGSSSTPRRGPE